MKIYKTKSTEDPFPVMGMANLIKRRTNLPIVVWINQGVGLPHGPRVKGNEGAGDKVDATHFFSMTIEDVPRLVSGNPEKASYAKELSKWIILNKQVLLDYWSGVTDDTVQVAQDLKPLP